MTLTRVARGGGNLDVIFEVDGVPTDADLGVTVTVIRADGAAIVTAAATTKVAGVAGRYRWPLPPQTRLDHLTLDWTGIFIGVERTLSTRAEVVGGFYVTLGAIRALPNLGDAAKFTAAELAAARTWFEDTFEDYTGVAWVPRFRRVVLNGSNPLLLPDLLPRRILSVRTHTSATTYTAYAVDDLAGIIAEGSGLLRRWSGSFPIGRHNIVVEYEHGHDAPPSDVVEAAKVAIRDRLLNDNVGNRQYSVQTEAGIVRSSTPGPDRPFGIPAVDAVANRRAIARSGVGSLVIA